MGSEGLEAFRNANSYIPKSHRPVEHKLTSSGMITTRSHIFTEIVNPPINDLQTATFVRCFLDNIALTYDMFNSRNIFTQLALPLARTEPLLMHAILMCGAASYYKTNRKRENTTGLHIPIHQEDPRISEGYYRRMLIIKQKNACINMEAKCMAYLFMITYHFIKSEPLKREVFLELYQLIIKFHWEKDIKEGQFPVNSMVIDACFWTLIALDFFTSFSQDIPPSIDPAVWGPVLKMHDIPKKAKEIWWVRFGLYANLKVNGFKYKYVKDSDFEPKDQFSQEWTVLADAISLAESCNPSVLMPIVSTTDYKHFSLSQISEHSIYPAVASLEQKVYPSILYSSTLATLVRILHSTLIIETNTWPSYKNNNLLTSLFHSHSVAPVSIYATLNVFFGMLTFIKDTRVGMILIPAVFASNQYLLTNEEKEAVKNYMEEVLNEFHSEGHSRYLLYDPLPNDTISRIILADRRKSAIEEMYLQNIEDKLMEMKKKRSPSSGTFQYQMWLTRFGINSRRDPLQNALRVPPVSLHLSQIINDVDRQHKILFNRTIRYRQLLTQCTELRQQRCLPSIAATPQIQSLEQQS